jgi:hypothetical protein
VNIDLLRLQSKLPLMEAGRLASLASA